MRILFCSTAGAGHIGPLLPIARELSGLGHSIRFLLPPAGRGVAEAAGFPVVAAPAPDPAADAAIWEAVRRDPTRATVLINRDYFGRLCTEATLPAALEQCADWKPGLVLHEAAEYASALAAHRTGIPHIQVAIGLAEVEWASLRRHAALVLPEFEPDAERIISASPYLTRLPAVFDPSPYVRTLRYRVADGPAQVDAPGTPGAEPEPAVAVPPGGRLVYATLGSMAGRPPWSPGAYRVLLDASDRLGRRRATRDVSILLTIGRQLDPATLGPFPGNTSVVPWVAQERAFAAASAVLSHGGSGTAYGALAAGLPSVYFPLFADQPNNAALLESAGAGIRVDTADLREHGVPLAAEPADRARLAALADEAAEALATVLGDPAYAARARELGAHLTALPPLSEALAEYVA